MSAGITRERVRHELAVRRVTVAAVTDITSEIRRVTFTGADLQGFTAPGPADHVKIFFPDPATGILSVPAPGKLKTPPPAGEKRIARDYTPFEFRADPLNPEIDIDFVLHGPAGVASDWAQHAQPGDQLAIAGPRGSALLPAGITALVMIVDETAYPTAHRWLSTLEPEIPISALIVANDATAPATYFAADFERLNAQVFTATAETPDNLLVALRNLGSSVTSTGADDSLATTYFFLAGEAKTLIPLRRYLRRELDLPKNQVEVHGYWKRGVVALDHHAPLDPSDPDE